MHYSNAFPLLWMALVIFETGPALSHCYSAHRLQARIKRANGDTGFDQSSPSIPPWLSQQPQSRDTQTPQAVPSVQNSRSSNSDSYAAALTDGFYPNYGFGLLFQRPVTIGGGLTWPTGNVLQPNDRFNGTLDLVRPVQLQFGTQGGPLYPWQNPRFTKTVRELSEASGRTQGVLESQRLSQRDPFVITDPALKRTVRALKFPNYVQAPNAFLASRNHRW